MLRERRFHTGNGDAQFVDGVWRAFGEIGLTQGELPVSAPLIDRDRRHALIKPRALGSTQCWKSPRVPGEKSDRRGDILVENLAPHPCLPAAHRIRRHERGGW